MNRKEDASLLISALGNMKNKLDSVFKPMRTEIYQNPHMGWAWILKPFYRAIFHLKPSVKIDSIGKSVMDLLSSPYIAILIALGYISKDTIAGVQEGLQVVEIKELVISNIDSIHLLLIGLYVLGVVIQFFRLTRVGDKYFDIHAFRLLQPKLYDIFQTFRESESFSFHELYNGIREISYLSSEKAYKAIELIEKKEQVIEELEKEQEESEIAFGNLLSQLQKQVKSHVDITNLFNYATDALLSFSNGTFSKDDLRVKTDFSLFRKEGNLLKRVASHRTSNTPEIIDLLDPHFSQWATVIACTQDEDELVLDESHGRVIGSRRFDVDGTIYVYNFHFHTTEEEYYDIIDEREMGRLIYCLLHVYHHYYLEKVEGSGNRATS